MHGIEFDDFFMDGVPFVTQLPQIPGSTETYEFVAKPYGSMMYHSHHNATEQVGHGLLGALIIDPKDPKETYKEKYGVTQEYTWISNDSIGGFTINGHGFPATVPIVAAIGERVLVRFMNEGIMMHPWHSHGYRMHVVARDGADLGTASFYCRHARREPGRAVGRDHRGGPARDLGLPLPHPPARRGAGRDVRHGQRARRDPGARRPGASPQVTTQVAPPAPRLGGATAARPAAMEAHVARIETILLATDASSASGAATLHAIDLAARLGAQLVVLTVLSTARPRPPGPRRGVERCEQARRAHARGAAGRGARPRRGGARDEPRLGR